MTEVEKEGIGKAKLGLMVCAVLVVILAISSVWLYTRVDSLQNQINTLARAPEEKAKAIIVAYVADARGIPEWRVRIDEVELRPPTEDEARILEQFGEKTPEIIWFATVTTFYEDVGPRANTIWLDAYSGEIIYAVFLD